MKSQGDMRDESPLAPSQKSLHPDLHFSTFKTSDYQQAGEPAGLGPTECNTEFTEE